MGIKELFGFGKKPGEEEGAVPAPETEKPAEGEAAPEQEAPPAE